MKQIYCVGYPKSGNTWLNYICLTLRGQEFDNIHTQYDWPGYLKTHAVKEGEEFDRDNLLITPVRDYKECIISYRGGHDIKKLTEAIKPFKPGTMNYIRPLEIYDTWPKERRHMVYYENLIEHPASEIYRIAVFLNCEHRWKRFIQRIEHHKARCLRHYDGDAKESKSRGCHIDYWKKNLSPDGCKQWDETIKKAHPELFEKYLKRYG